MMLKGPGRRAITEMASFALVGTVSTAVNYSIFYALFAFGVFGHLLSSASGYVIGIATSYSLNRRFTFSPTEKGIGREAALYVTVCLVSLVLSLLTLEGLVRYVGINPLLANVFGICVSTAANFVGAKFFVF